MTFEFDAEDMNSLSSCVLILYHQVIVPVDHRIHGMITCACMTKQECIS